MRQYFLEFSKYIIVLLMAWYTLEAFLELHPPKKEGSLKRCNRQRILIFLVQFFCFVTLALQFQSVEYVFFYGFVQIFLLSTLIFVKMIYEKINCLLLNNMGMLLGLGFVLQARFSLEKAIRQLTIALITLFFCLLIPIILKKVSFIRKLTWLYALIGIAGLLSVLVAGEVTHGSKLSLDIAKLAFQPSEFIKIVFVFFLAAALYQNCSFARIALTTVIAAIHVIILVLSKDLGSACIFFIAYLLMVYIATGSLLYLTLGVLAGGMGAWGAYYLFEHVRIRVLAWQNPFSYIDNQGYQITQSLFAISNGEWFGYGLGKGVPGDIPYVETDFIFSALCEEMGVLCGICLLLICISSFLAMMTAGLKLKDKFYRLVASGLGIIYLFQIFLTVGGGIKFIPLTGVTLPFISYGGSSVLTTLILYFIVMSFSMKEQVGSIEKGVGNSERRYKRHTLCITYSFTGIFLLMMGYLVYFTATSKDLINNSYNSRQELLLSENYRGTICASNGQILAGTVLDEQGEKRIYPFAEVFSHVVGYSTRGKTGIEALANYYLIHSNIPFPQKNHNENKGLKNPGDTVYTNLDVDLQQAAYTALDNYQGAVIVTQPATGKILAMVSKPDYNPNEILTIWNDLTEDTESSALLNRTTQGLYPPGSTFKILTALEYIRENPDTFHDYTYTCEGYYQADDTQIQCYRKTSHGLLDLTESFAKSCNASFVNIGMQLSGTAFNDTLLNMGFQQTLPVTFSAALSQVADFTSISSPERMQTVIGQGKTLITPLHLNMITAAIANEGVMMTPYLIDRIETVNGDLVKAFTPDKYRTVMTVSEASALTELMTAVTEYGTASGLSDLAYTVAGKTGSAEYGAVKGASHAWFTGFAPVTNPEICVTVIVEGAGNGGEYAVPIAKSLFDAYFDKIALPK